MALLAVAPEVSRLLARIVVSGLAAALLVAAGGVVLERARFGRDDRAALGRIEGELRDRFAASAATLAAIGAALEPSYELVAQAGRDSGAARRLFERAEAALPDAGTVSTGVTIYDATAAPLAWAGRVSDAVPRERIQGPAALFVTLSALGPQLVRSHPVLDPDRSGSSRVGTVVVEHLLGQMPASPGAPGRFVLDSSLVPVTVRARLSRGADESPYRLLVPATDGQLLVEAEVAPEDLIRARRRWRSRTRGWTLAILGLTLLAAVAPLTELRRMARNAPPLLAATAAIVALLAGARGLAWLAIAPFRDAGTAWTSVDLVLTAMLAAALVWLAFDLFERRRTAAPRRPLVRAGGPAAIITALLLVAAGVAAAALLWGYERLLQVVLAGASLDLLHFSLHMVDLERLALSVGLVLLHAAAVWATALLVRGGSVRWRRPRSRVLTGVAVTSWVLGAGVGVAAARLSDPVPLGPLVLALTAAGAAGAALTSRRWRRHRRSQAARLLALYLVLLLPSIALYPSLHAAVVAATERLVAGTYGPQAITLRRDLRESLRGALDDVDALASLAAFLPDAAGGPVPTTDEAFQIWWQTDLAATRLTSSVELYAGDGRLVSRFALNLPDYSVTTYKAASCDWDIVEEVSPFGPSERHLFRASRGICEQGHRQGAVVLRAMLDFDTLPFLSSESLYFDALAPRPVRDVRAAALDLEFVVYGWSRAPLYVSGTNVWELPDRVFQRMVESRDPFWATLTGTTGDAFRVHFLNDRDGIYAVGYPLVTAFGHLVNLAELAALTGVLYVALLAAGSAVRAIVSQTPASGRALLREVRSSFYRKLFLAFVAAAVVPVVILAFATRTYLAAQFLAGLEESAAQTATIARRLVEDYATLQQPGTRGLQLLDDRVMELVGRAIDEPVNLFARGRLQATSERDLFASGLLPTRTPAEVYRQIVLDRLPTFVGEEQGGGQQYLVAAAPVRSGGSEAIVTVPQPLRRQQIDKQIDELDRRVLFAAILFVLLGAAAGYWMAERIADPVNRLTRATRRIARGDLDLRIAATSSDELRRLVEDFNRMAEDLKRQRAELERTKRLEAWAEVARQVAHDIKNPLTPIQLSAEHARRLNLDRGRPLSPALDECVNAILTQVKLLRQISAEFSSFATSPTARPEPTDLARLIEEVVEPYRTGLAGRIDVDVQAAPNLPPALIDRTLFARALTNIVENALHAMPGYGRLTIRSRFPPPVDGPLVVEITDSGVGMDQDALDRIFEPYFSTKATGTGLGLTIARRNIELNGGTIAVASQRGAGTTVTMTIPRAGQS